jgi:hypothetical protein
VVHVDLDHLELACQVPAEPLEDRRDHLARRAPFGPEVDEDERLRRHGGVEVVVAGVDEPR